MIYSFIVAQFALDRVTVLFVRKMSVWMKIVTAIHSSTCLWVLLLDFSCHKDTTTAAAAAAGKSETERKRKKERDGHQCHVLRQSSVLSPGWMCVLVPRIVLFTCLLTQGPGSIVTLCHTHIYTFIYIHSLKLERSKRELSHSQH